MGKILKKIYDIVTEKKGFKGRIMLAEITGISREDASSMEETEEVIQKFKNAASEIIEEDISKYLTEQ